MSDRPIRIKMIKLRRKLCDWVGPWFLKKEQELLFFLSEIKILVT